MIDRITSIARPQSAIDPKQSAPAPAEDAAREFERILVGQLVRAMTDSLFRESIGGEDGPRWMEGYAETQREVLNDALASHLIKSGTVRLSDLMLRQWGGGHAPGGPDTSYPTERNR